MSEEKQRPPSRIQEPVLEHSHTVIFLHGGGSDGPQLWRAIRRMRPGLFEQFPSFRWVFPCAGLLWSSSQEIERSQWLDVNPRDSSHSIPGLGNSVRYVLELIREEIQLLGGRPERLVLAGMSQGQATSLTALLCCKHRLGAYFGASGWLPLAHELEGVDDLQTASQILRKNLLDDDSTSEGSVEGTPVFLGHGTYDLKVPLQLAVRARDVLKCLKMDVSWRQYVGAKLNGHWFKEPEELQDIADFLRVKLLLD